MAFTTEQVLTMIDSSEESDIEEDPSFPLPHDSDFEEDELPLPSAIATQSGTQSGIGNTSDESNDTSTK